MNNQKGYLGLHSSSPSLGYYISVPARNYELWALIEDTAKLPESREAKRIGEKPRRLSGGLRWPI